MNRVIVRDSVGSTNDELRLMARDGAPEGTVLIAREQTDGRGRLRRRWHSPRDLGLYLSILIRPALPAGELPRWTIAAAVAGVRVHNDQKLLIEVEVKTWDELEEMAAVCDRVPRHPARSFREAVQAFWFQHLAVMYENPFGGNGPGRIDYYLWPYLEADLDAGRTTMTEARELMEQIDSAVLDEDLSRRFRDLRRSMEDGQ